jgi:hypothetical protein
MYMNLAYRFLSQPSSSRARGYFVRPFVDTFSHQTATTNMLRTIYFPDANVNATSVLLVEGDFTTSFLASKNHYFDAVVTHFFIDTARNLMSYFETIHKLLQKGGYWINFGPLLYGSAPFIQLSLMEILDVVEAMGFELIDIPDTCGELTIPGRKARTKLAMYGFDNLSLVNNAYRAQFWVARKIQD